MEENIDFRSRVTMIEVQKADVLDVQGNCQKQDQEDDGYCLIEGHDYQVVMHLKYIFRNRL